MKLKTSEMLEALAERVGKAQAMGRFAWGTWIRTPGRGSCDLYKLPSLEPFQDCNSSACVAGWATVLFPDLLEMDLVNGQVVTVGNPERTGSWALAGVLGITKAESEWLCHPIQGAPGGYEDSSYEIGEPDSEFGAPSDIRFLGTLKDSTEAIRRLQVVAQHYREMGR